MRRLLAAISVTCLTASADASLAGETNLWQAVKVCTSHKLTATGDWRSERFEPAFHKDCARVYELLYSSYKDPYEKRIIRQGLSNPEGIADPETIAEVDRGVLIRYCTSTPGRTAPHIPECQKLRE